jgi:hypothetical protein
VRVSIEAAGGELGRRTRHVDTPVKNPTPTAEQEVLVRDPCHPLYGRRFRVAARPRQGMGSGARYILVFYRPDVQLRLPLAAIDLPKTGQAPRTKLTGSTIAEIVSIFQALRSESEGNGRVHRKQGAEHAHRSKATLGVTPNRAQRADRRRSCRRTSGGAR